MEKNEIKKVLYKENPMALFQHAKKGNLNYTTKIANDFEVKFQIPFSDIGDAIFENEMEAKFLIRWIV